MRPGGLAAQPFGVIAGRHQQQRAVSGPTPCRASSPGARAVTSGTMRSSSRSSWPSRNSTRRPSSRNATRTAYPAASPGRGRSAAMAPARAAAECRASRARRSSGPVRISERAWPLAWVRSLRALRLATISARIASTAPSRPLGAPAARPDCAARAALTASSGSSPNYASRAARLRCRTRSRRLHRHSRPAALTSKSSSEEKLGGQLSTVCPVSAAIRLATWLLRPGNRHLPDSQTIGRRDGYAC